MREPMVQLCLQLSLVLAFFGGAVMEKGENTGPLSINELETQIKELAQGDYQDAQKTKALYEGLEEHIESAIEKHIKKELSRDPKYSMRHKGQLHNLLIIAGNWRMSGTVDELTEGIDLRLDRSEIDTAGISFLPQYFYPVASALAKIGGHRAMLNMLSVIRTGEPRERELAVWVMYEAFGPEFAKAVIKSAADQERNPKLQNRLRDAVKLVDKEGKLLLKQREN